MAKSKRKYERPNRREERIAELMSQGLSRDEAELQQEEELIQKMLENEAFRPRKFWETRLRKIFATTREREKAGLPMFDTDEEIEQKTDPERLEQEFMQDMSDLLTAYLDEKDQAEKKV